MLEVIGTGPQGKEILVVAGLGRAAPVIRRVLSWLVGWRYDGSDSARQRLARQLPIVTFRPMTKQ